VVALAQALMLSDLPVAQRRHLVLPVLLKLRQVVDSQEETFVIAAPLAEQQVLGHWQLVVLVAVVVALVRLLMAPATRVVLVAVAPADIPVLEALAGQALSVHLLILQRVLVAEVAVVDTLVEVEVVLDCLEQEEMAVAVGHQLVEVVVVLVAHVVGPQVTLY
jgi:hypothetical protein